MFSTTFFRFLSVAGIVVCLFSPTFVALLVATFVTFFFAVVLFSSFDFDSESNNNHFLNNLGK